MASNIKNLKIQLGDLIKEIRKNKNMSQRELARKINLSNSNLKYIEDGVNAPTPEVYRRLVEIISPSDEELKLLDKLYSDVRGAPPLEVCNFLIKNSDLYSVIRNNNFKLSKDQIAKISSIISKEDKIKEL
ncbi:helix-turn-helix domain-containing protein [Campylobacter sp. RM16187]|uniref:helix-turn-helix domain-containing protein n=1 Tax=Campylobacter sp. RM16187 TaxID=1660063 RepID=UPI0021B6BEC8|nr:helix-turn-helix transcriptional regulator [Campylobacter sp. RM16187]